MMRESRLKAYEAVVLFVEIAAVLVLMLEM